MLDQQICNIKIHIKACKNWLVSSILLIYLLDIEKCRMAFQIYIRRQKDTYDLRSTFNGFLQ